MIQHSPLGKAVAYRQDYAPDLLYAIPRAHGRGAIGLPSPLPFHGVDMWTGYELSWLTLRGKPQVAVAQFRIPATSPCIVESKSFKLYLNSLNGSRFDDREAVREILARDVGRVAGAAVEVALVGPEGWAATTCELEGESIDGLDIAVNTDELRPAALAASGPCVAEALRSDLLKSNCPVTGQPDWASVVIRYRGPRIDRAALLEYIVSYRNHAGFHEQCVEQIFVDVKERCRAEQLTVYARYMRRGGLDINPFRSDFEASPVNARTYRQ